MCARAAPVLIGSMCYTDANMPFNRLTFYTSHLREQTATRGSHLTDQTLPIEDLSHHLATPPPADTALMPNSGSLCNSKGARHLSYVQERWHALKNVHLYCKLCAAHSCLLFFFLRRSLPARAQIRFVVAENVLFNTTRTTTILSRLAFDSGYAAIIAMLGVRMLKPQS